MKYNRWLGFSLLGLLMVFTGMSGAEAQSPDTGLLPVQQDGLWGFIDSQGKVAIQPRFLTIYDFGAFQDGLAMVLDQETRKWGFIDQTGVYRIKPQYDSTMPFAEGVTVVTSHYNWIKPADGVKDWRLDVGRYGFIDETGKTVIPFRYGLARPFAEGLAVVVANGRWDSQGTIVDGKWGVINRNGKFVVKPKYAFILDFKDGRALVNAGGVYTMTQGCEGGKWGVIDQKGTEIVAPQFDGVYWTFTEGLLKVRRGEKWGFIDRNGKVAVQPQFEDADGFSQGLAAVNQGGVWQYQGYYYGVTGGKWGFINAQGEMVIPLEYDMAFGFENGYAKARWSADGSKPHWGLIDKRGKTVVPPRYEDLVFYNTENIVIRVKAGAKDKWGLMNLDGKIRIKPVYDDLKLSLEHQVAVFNVGMMADGKSRGKWGLMTLDGKILVQPKYDNYMWMEHGLIKVFEGNKTGYLRRDGSILWPPTE